MAFAFMKKNGKKGLLLNPSEKAAKFSEELRLKKRMTNMMELKDKPLTKEGAAYRSGYLDARKDSANAWKHNKAKAPMRGSTTKRKSK